MTVFFILVALVIASLGGMLLGSVVTWVFLLMASAGVVTLSALHEASFSSMSLSLGGVQASLVILVSLIFVFLNSAESSNFFVVSSPRYSFLHCWLAIILTAFFSVDSALQFYFLFEASLVPMLFLIIGWGYQPERLLAGISLVMYMVVSSLPLLVALSYLESLMASAKISELILRGQSSEAGSSVMGLALILGFLVKSPMFFLHLWLPKAHVEAPLSGSVLLAGVLLKTGGYGLLIASSVVGVSTVISAAAPTAVAGSGVAAVLCLMQTDVKVLIAYFSVVHMGSCIACAVVGSTFAVKGLVLVMFSHGLCSAALFTCAYVSYASSSSRSMLLNSGVSQISPVYLKILFFVFMGNMGTPPTLNFIGEVVSYVCLVQKSLLYLAPSSAILMFGVVATILCFTGLAVGRPLVARSGTPGIGVQSFFSGLILLVALGYLSVLTSVSVNSR